MSFPFPAPGTVQAGDLLIADPSLNEGIFNRAVILLADHTKNGAFGVILNQPSGERVEKYLRDPEFAALRRIPIYVGGPVAREHLTFAAFWRSPDDELRYAFRISAEEAIHHSRNAGTLVKAFVGYSGWEAGQLEDELESASWIKIRPPKELLAMPHEESLWSKTLTAISPYHKLLSYCPRHPWKN